MFAGKLVSCSQGGGPAEESVTGALDGRGAGQMTSQADIALAASSSQARSDSERAMEEDFR